MEKITQTHFTTGEFAKLCHVSKHTLFHYDKLGIFSPAIKDGKDYRYYAVSQIEIFYVISALKELDMPLKEIKAYIDRRSPKELIHLLQKEEEAIDSKIEGLNRLKQMIHQKIELTKEACEVEPHTISVEWCESEYLIATDAKGSQNAKSITLDISNHIQYCENHNIYSPYAISGMLSQDSVKNKTYSEYINFYTRVKQKPNHVPIFEKQNGHYLIAYHTGGFYTVEETYEKMLAYATNHQLILSGYFYEEVLLDELSVIGYENYVLKISIMIDHPVAND
ncbi:MAG: MerR family transcriptional regulator [Turicibacter sp.]